MKIPKFKTKEIKRFLGKLPRIVGEHQFITALILIFLALILGGFIFYQYSFLVEKKEIELREKPLYFQEKTFQEILKIWQEREKRLKETDLKEYPDLFKPKLTE